MKPKSFIVGCAAAMAVGLVVNTAQAGSIWAKRCANSRVAFTDDVARNIGDLLTIKVSEASTVDNKAKRDLKKDVTRSSQFDGKLGIGTPTDMMVPYMPGFTMDATGSNALNGKADFKDERKFTDSITVVVLDILPNRNLVVQGTRDRNIAGDIQTIEVSGIVRPSDIAFDNTVKSEQVANFKLVTQNKGISASYNKPGWLSQVLDVVWPW